MQQSARGKYMKTQYMVTFLADQGHRVSVAGVASVSMNFRME